LQKLENYKSLQHTIKCLKKQVIDSLPYIAKYVPSDISTPEELFYFLKDLITYKKDPPGVELLQSVQTLFDNNFHGKSGHGDCDCFTILALASFEHLGFDPSQVALAGRSEFKPSHIYTRVWDKKKNRYAVFDLTNPYYDMERKYNYKQYIDFMMLQMADNYAPLSGKKQRVAKRTARKGARVVKKQEKSKRKIVKQTSKTARVTSRQDRRTDRVEQKGARKGLKRGVKVARKEKKLLRVKGQQEIIKARQKEKLDNIFNRSQEPGGGGGSFFPGESEEEAAYEPFYSPKSDEIQMPSEEQSPGSDYEPSDYYDDYEMIPEEEEEYYEEEEPLELPFIPAAISLIKKGAAKLKASKGAQVVQRGTSKYNEIVSLKSERDYFKSKSEEEAKNKIIYTTVGTAAGTLAGILIGRATK
jgi:hypothetical protein